jgi:hypothetical protein
VAESFSQKDPGKVGVVVQPQGTTNVPSMDLYSLDLQLHINIFMLIILFFYCCAGGALWHFQKLLQCIKYIILKYLFYSLISDVLECKEL